MNRRTLTARSGLAVVLVAAVFVARGAAGEGGEAASSEPAACQACHPDVVAEWARSMHARSTAAANPLYRVVLDKARAALGREKADAACQRCHEPGPAVGVATGSGGALGVSCGVCHELAPGHPEERLPGGAHARFAGGAATAQARCLGCHATLRTPAGHPACTTGPEAEEAGAGDCTDCHMPTVDGPATRGDGTARHAAHTFPGSRDAAFLAEAATVALSVEGGEGGAARHLVATVATGDVGHAVPTGTPQRSVVLRVALLDAAGATIWRNFEANPLAEAPDAVFQHVFTAPDGTRPVPPFLSTAAGDDRRLRPGAPRTLRYPIAAGAVAASAVLEYRLAPAPILEAAGFPEEARKPVAMARAALRL